MSTGWHLGTLDRRAAGRHPLLAIGLTLAAAVACGHETIELLETPGAGLGAGGVPSDRHTGGATGSPDPGSGGSSDLPEWDPCANDPCDLSREYCDPFAGCLRYCEGEWQCMAERPFCDPIVHLCVECLVPDDCADRPSGGPVCVRGMCAECDDDFDCPDEQRSHCDTQGTLKCRECLVPDHCPPGKMCDRSDGVCH